MDDKLFLSVSILPPLIAETILETNFSEEIYFTFFLFPFSEILFPIACIKCVLPRPTPP